MLGEEIKHGEVAFGVPDHAGIILQLEQAEASLMILQGLELELGAIIRRELEGIVTAIVGRQMLVEARLVILEERHMSEGPFSVRPPFGIHLQQAEVQAELKFLLAVQAFESADYDLSGLELPVSQQT